MSTQMSLPSISILDINVPEVSDLKCNFRYNFYTSDERTTEFLKNLPVEKLPRYVFISWTPARLSINDSKESDVINSKKNDDLYKNREKIVSETDYANPDYISHTFSDISTIEQGSTEIENYSRIIGSPSESVSAMAQEQLDEIIKASGKEKVDSSQRLAGFQRAFSSLSNLPKNSLGMRVIDSKGSVIDDEEFLKTVLDSVSLNVKVNKKVSIDVFKNSSLTKKDSNLQMLKEIYVDAKRFIKNRNKTLIDPVSIRDAYTTSDRKSFRVLGYIIQRYEITKSGLESEKTFYVDGANQSTFYDQTVLYGKEYFYTVKTVSSMNVLAYAYDEESPILAELYVASKPVTSAVECFEYVPPPEPEFMKFVYDHTKRNLLILWEAPTNHQADIRQYQVFRRKSIYDPFELIAQYCFDKSDEGPEGQRYTTGEKIDGNSKNLPKEFTYLVQQSNVPVLTHRDVDFTVDEEFYESSAYIYAICSVDAHGMISNYSTQYHVTFDPYKNRIVSKVISDLGAPKPYPNMKLKLDAFKDTIRIEGQNQRQLKIAFSPEYFKVSDDKGIVHQVVETNYPGRPVAPYYLFQMINLDNQKIETIKLTIQDPESIAR